MKTLNFLCTVLALMIILSLTGCIGDEGPMGTQGEQGIAGLDGNVFYSGNTAPAANVGKDGDMYLDKVSATLYGPKQSGSWGTGISLKGAEGPQGQPGATGQQGAPGTQGPAGTPGSKILSGNGSPASSIGATADYYLDKTTGLLYGPKSESSWGNPINLKGEQGIQGLPGKDGSMFYSGNGAPLLSVGKEGDMYLDKTNVLLYGPKTSGSWGAGTSLKGNTGEAGAPGTPGIPGSKILSDNGSPDLSIGATGDYYLDKITSLLYGPKSESSWGNPINLKGEQGIQGLPGKDGSMFYSGNETPASSLGKDGDMYLDKVSATLYGPKLSGSWGTGISLKGAEGPQGQPGATGQQGAPGTQGPAGTPGSKILSGNGSPASSIGATADYYLDKTTGLLYGPKSESSWGNPINLKGEQGIQGLPGKDGSMFYSGNETPASSLGKDGDMYLDKTNVLLYGPKTSGSWGAGTSLKGNTGEAGSPGTPGSKILSGTGAPNLSMGALGDFYLDTSGALFYGPKTSTSWGTPVNLKGPKGDKGDKGDKGESGTANVIYSDWMVAVSSGNNSIYYLKMTELYINRSLIDNASITVYAKELNTDGTTVSAIHQLNFTSPIWGSRIEYRIDFNSLDMVITAVPDTKMGLNATHLFRYVIIPGGVQATRSMVDLSNYNAVKEAFGLKD